MNLDLFSLKNKTAIVTGGGKGLGAQMARVLALAGANVVVCSRDLEACEKVSGELVSFGAQSLAIACDVTSQKDIQNVIDQTVAQFGTIDILINNSGTSWMAPALELPADKWDKVMNVNVRGVFLFSQAAAKVMKSQGSGKIINIASVTGMGGTPAELMDTIAYSTSKGAVISFTKDLAVKLAPDNIQVNAIAPGFFPTKMTKTILEKENAAILKGVPARRFGTEGDLDGVILLLSGKASDYIIGQVLVVDGGITALV
ncbi:SDR family oxidoreductase [Metabacillus indicus]|uniref:Gluconate 5-dehydrogenase n=1 Tax=Metabacillus indicus TaxID=246786 RepID=A0A084H2D7_METID|nr:SDR family oxidoreductase [Metabacillus indicus]KEZ52539.1 gluconate 5-dehydrogenase [Metabacillus indicus LMG 22858]KEZ53749.1 gluconate 5-dehydrogenase [Metabacillus indicus]